MTLSTAFDPDHLSVALAKSPVFAALSQEGRERLASRSSAFSLSPGQVLCAAGDPADAAFMVLMGELEIALSQPGGGDVWLGRASPGDVVGDLALLDGGTRSAEIRARTKVRLLRLGRDAVLEALRAEPAAALKLLEQLARLLRDTNRQLESMASLDLKARLARLLLQSPQGILRHSQGEIARIIGARRESVNRKLAAWRKAGLVEVTQAGVKVADADALRREALGEA